MALPDEPRASATYTSPHNAPFERSYPISDAPSSDKGSTSLSAAPSATADKVSFLADVRRAVTSLQTDINQELTARMEEDKAKEASSQFEGKPTGNATAAARRLDEVQEEENYGEELQEEGEM